MPLTKLRKRTKSLSNHKKTYKVRKKEYLTSSTRSRRNSVTTHQRSKSVVIKPRETENPPKKIEKTVQTKQTTKNDIQTEQTKVTEETSDFIYDREGFFTNAHHSYASRLNNPYDLQSIYSAFCLKM